MPKRLLQAFRDLLRPRGGNDAPHRQANAGDPAHPDAPVPVKPRLAVFGKHPGWNDHIDDQGEPSPAMLTIKRLLYVEGIGGNIDAGAWEPPSRAVAADAAAGQVGRLLADFDHLFVWRWPERLFVGRFWNSSDGKGRKRYPMIGCIELGADAPIAASLAELWPVLESLARDCRAGKTADDVRSAVSATQQALDASTNLSAAFPAAAPIQPDDLGRQLAAVAPFNSSRAGLLSILYHLDRERDQSLPASGDGWPSRTSGRDNGAADPHDAEPVVLHDPLRRPVHVRVPTAPADIAALAPDGAAPLAREIELWHQAVRTLLRPDAPILALVPLKESWMDLIAGAPRDRDLACIRLTPAAIPLASDIPYSLPDDFAARFGLDAP